MSTELVDVSLFNQELAIIRIHIASDLNRSTVPLVYSKLKEIRRAHGLGGLVLYIDVRKAHLQTEALTLVFDALEIQKMTKLAVAVVHERWLHFAFEKLSGKKSHGFYKPEDAIAFMHKQLGDFDDTGLA